MMKKATTLIFGMVLLLLLGSGQVLGQVVIAQDDASDAVYTVGWGNGDNGGSGFTNWDLWTQNENGYGGHYIGSSSGEGFGEINSDGKSFSMYGHSGKQANAQRFITNTGSPEIDGRGYLLPGMKFSLDLAIAHRNGYKGIDLFDQNFNQLFNFNVENDEYSTSDGLLVEWAHSQQSVFKILVEQFNSTEYEVTILRGADEYKSGLRTGQFSGFKLYVGNTWGGEALNNLHANNFRVFTSGETELTGNPGFRLLSSPVDGTTLETLLKNNDIFTQCFEGATDNSGICKPYGEATEEGDVTENVFFYENNSWLPANNISNSLAPGTGVIAYIFAEDIGESITVSGNENSGDISPTLNPNNEGWTLVGNPYSSTIDFGAVDKTGLTNAVYVWNPNLGNWMTYAHTGDAIEGAGDLTGGLVAPFQGFFVQNDSDEKTNPSLTFNTDDKSSGGTFYGKQITSDPQFVRLQVEGNGLSNSAWLQFSEQGSDVEQVRGDAVELESLSPQFAQLAFQKNDQNLLDIAHLPIQDGNYEIPVQFTATTNGAYKLSATDFEIPAGLELTFHDYQENVNVAITEDFTYTFELNTAAKVADVPPLKRLQQGPLMAKAADSQRFGISIKAKTGVSNEPGMGIPQDFALEQNYPNPFNPSTVIRYQVAINSAVTLKVYDVMGREISTLVNGRVPAGSHQVMFDAAALSSGIYYYRLQSAGQVLTRQMTLIK